MDRAKRDRAALFHRRAAGPRGGDPVAEKKREEFFIGGAAMTAVYEKHLHTAGTAEFAQALRTGAAVSDLVQVHMSADSARWLARQLRRALWCLALGAGLALAGGVLVLHGWGVV